MSKLFPLLVLFLIGLTACGEIFDDGTGSGELKDWGYVSNYRGATGQSRAFEFKTRHEIATVLVEAMEMSNRILNNAYKPLNTPLLLDNVTYTGAPPPLLNLEEFGNCGGSKIYNTDTFARQQGYFRSNIEYKSFCSSGNGPSGSTVISGGKTFEDEEFDNATSGTVRAVYSETTFDNVSVNINGVSGGQYKLYGIMVRRSDRSAKSNGTSTLKTETVDDLKSVHFGLDMPKGGEVYRFDIYDNVTAGNSRYIEFYYPSSGYVKVDMTSLRNDDTIGEITPITMEFYDNEKCVFTKLGLKNYKPDSYDKWFDCKTTEYEPKY